MLEQLQQMFPNLIMVSDEAKTDAFTYKWYVTEQNEIVGIPQADLSEREMDLLELFLTPYKAVQLPTTDKEKWWIDILFHREIPKHWLENQFTSYHFVYFSLSDELIDPESFREAIYGLFPDKTPILWENNHEGVIIQETEHSMEDMVSYAEIIEVLTSDFYINIKLFVSPSLYDIQQAPDFYQWIKKCFHITKSYNHDVLPFTDAIPYLFLHHITAKERQLILDSVLYPVKEEAELLKTVQVFLESNSNATLAAKKMYMHRNSLQYRVDKFIEKTGIDVKQFNSAIAVYLCFILKWENN
ncbi:MULTISPECIES: PucR family transcriptional regulator [Gracilibacillus]|uniref:PucR family transcriptional regulator n=1 Tax=Gracilibacillus TaxID=74385 RepID=UPI00082427A4|nr:MULTISPECIES: helix-turn-helix domain-containing protein [Gracilibacillus]